LVFRSIVVVVQTPQPVPAGRSIGDTLVKQLLARVLISQSQNNTKNVDQYMWPIMTAMIRSMTTNIPPIHIQEKHLVGTSRNHIYFDEEKVVTIIIWRHRNSHIMMSNKQVGPQNI
jgi:hypothetical protein